MSNQYVGEIRLFAGNFAPAGWAFCLGQLMPIAQNDVLFSLIGTTYGGDGQSTFALPNLQSRMPIGQGNGAGLSPRTLGEMGGQEYVMLTANQIPSHNHGLMASMANAQSLSGGVILGTPSVSDGHLYVVDDGSTPPPLTHALTNGSINHVGGGQGHENLMPTLCVNYIIALVGVYPSQN